MKDSDDDLRGVIREEKHRGRQGVLDISAQRRIRRERQGFLELVRAGASDDKIGEALSALFGRELQPEELKEALRHCDAYRRGE